MADMMRSSLLGATSEDEDDDEEEDVYSREEDGCVLTFRRPLQRLLFPPR
jgi:hypothetical protein